MLPRRNQSGPTQLLTLIFQLSQSRGLVWTSFEKISTPLNSPYYQP
jgi:hypothetical protein